MSELKPTMAQRVAQAASAFQQKRRTGHARETDKDDAVEKSQDLGHKAVDKISPSPEKAQR